MRRGLLSLGITASLLTTPVVAQNRAQTSPPGPMATHAAATESALVLGKWTYRSYVNTPALVTDADSALAQIFGQGVFTFETPSSSTLTGTLDMGGGLVLDLKGTFRPAAHGSPLTIELVGTGRANTGTYGWQYDYNAYLAHQWPNGVNQVPALVGSVIRAKPHNGAPAGFVASFIAVKQP
jgi:hypothetical protein